MPSGTNPPEVPQAHSTADAPPMQTIRFCTQCGSGVSLERAEEDGRWRHVCGTCRHVHYLNPLMVVGCLVEHEGSVLLCRRGIEPQVGLWTLPAGFMELGEGSAEGAARETAEEAGAAIEDLVPYAHFDIPAIGQSYHLFRARLSPPFTFRAVAPESLDVQLFHGDQIPWDEVREFNVVALARS